MKNSRYRAPLKVAKGHGSAKSGTGHWINQRITGMAMIPLVILFMFTLVKLITVTSYSEIVDILANPFWLTALILFIIVGFYHGALGMQVMIEDYISAELPKMLLLIGLKLAAGFLTVLGVLSLLFIAFN
ncbi:MAG: succinate dehydrogenase, hydrophobic membrane anchor protein [Gammaproteobacteria bacterium]|nr:succinate dehydrogenase, hydrophobic membrane anchor protein [Gammaproteobacteria bacterium]